MSIFDDAWTGSVSGVKKKVKTTGNLDALSKDRKATALYNASRQGHLEIVQILIDAGANPNTKNKNEAASTPLHGAAFGGHPEVVQCLVDNGAKLLKNAYEDTAKDDAELCESSASIKKKIKKILDGAFSGKSTSPKSSKAASRDDKKEEASDDDDEEDFSSLTVAALKSLCTKKGLANTGKKADLVNRLEGKESTPKKETKKKKKEESSDSEEEPPKKKQKVEKKKEEPAASPAKADGGKFVAKKSGLPVPLGDEVAELKKSKFTLSQLDEDEEFWDLEKTFAAAVGRNNDYVKDRIKAGQKPLTFIIKKAWKVDAPVLEMRFKRRKAIMGAQNKTYARERASFHGTNPKNIDSILKTCLLRFKHPLNPCKEQADDGWFGTNKKGVYVSRNADYTLKYSRGQSPMDSGDTCKIIMFKTLPGESKHMTETEACDPTPGYHSHSSSSFLEWYLFQEDQLCPHYVIEVRAVDDNRTLADDGNDDDSD